MVILGVDPGLNATGYGLLDANGSARQALTAGDIRPAKGAPLAERLAVIQRTLAELIARWQPQVMVLEKLYTHYQHVTTAAMMGHARGVACVAAEQARIPVAEYSPNRVKKSVTGHGTASKQQVARMVKRWVGRDEPAWSYDATDALALAIAHAAMDSQHQRSEMFRVGRRARRHSGVAR